MRLKDKAIIVTGSSTGIGEAIARRCVAEGAKVIVHGLEEDLTRAVAASLGAAAHPVVCDLADVRTIAPLVAAAVERFGRLDALVNNAAWVLRANLHTTDAAMFDRCMAINLRAPFLMIQTALPHLKATRGCVLNIGSVNGYCGERNMMAYSISKGGLMTLSRNLADALGRDLVRVNHINMDWVLTANEHKYKMADGLPADWHEHPPLEFVPSGRLMTPQQAAEGCVYWLSDESRPVSGSVVDLGQYPVIGRNPPKVTT